MLRLLRAGKNRNRAKHEVTTVLLGQNVIFRLLSRQNYNIVCDQRPLGKTIVTNNNKNNTILLRLFMIIALRIFYRYFINLTSYLIIKLKKNHKEIQCFFFSVLVIFDIDGKQSPLVTILIPTC